jgi:hypothetical protein
LESPVQLTKEDGTREDCSCACHKRECSWCHCPSLEVPDVCECSCHTCSCEPACEDGYIRQEREYRRGGLQPVEYRTPILRGAEGMQALASFVTYLADRDAVVDSACGLHLHVGVPNGKGPWRKQDICCEHNPEERPMYLLSLGLEFGMSQDCLYRISGDGRAGNGYCRPLDSGRLRDIYNALLSVSHRPPEESLRYVDTERLGCNLGAYRYHNSTEFRLWRATLVSREVLDFLSLSLGTADKALANVLGERDTAAEYEKWTADIRDGRLVRSTRHLRRLEFGRLVNSLRWQKGRQNPLGWIRQGIPWDSAKGLRRGALGGSV